MYCFDVLDAGVSLVSMLCRMKTNKRLLVILLIIHVICDVLVSFILFLCGMICFLNLVFILSASVFTFYILYRLSL